jgi:photosystem II stability/assembly factor-like uncharacterized protein
LEDDMVIRALRQFCVAVFVVVTAAVVPALSCPPECPDGWFTETQIRNLTLVEVGPEDVVYGWSYGALYRSEDFGSSWTQIRDFEPSTGCGGLFVTSQGDVVLGTSGGYLTIGRPGDPWEWSTPLTFVCSGGTHPACMWKMGEDSEGRLFVGEYGGAWTDTCAYVHRSEDGGCTWALVYSCCCRHVHFVRVDPYTDFVYASIGDGADRQRLVRSVDHGDTWEVLYDEDCLAQPTGFAATPEHRLFGSDCGGGVCNCLYRTCDDCTFETCAVLDGCFDGYIWDMAGDGNVIVAGTKAKLDEGSETCLLVSYDGGVSWCRAKDFGVVPKWKGVNDISDFDSQGNAYYTFARPTGGFDAFRFSVGTGTGVSEALADTAPIRCAPRWNPSTGRAELEYAVPAGVREGSVAVFSVAGRLVRTLNLELDRSGSGWVAWDGCDARGIAVGSGIYFYRLETELGSAGGALVLLR